MALLSEPLRMTFFSTDRGAVENDFRLQAVLNAHRIAIDQIGAVADRWLNAIEAWTTMQPRQGNDRRGHGDLGEMADFGIWQSFWFSLAVNMSVAALTRRRENRPRRHDSASDRALKTRNPELLSIF